MVRERFQFCVDIECEEYSNRESRRGMTAWKALYTAQGNQTSDYLELWKHLRLGNLFPFPSAVTYI